MRPLLRYTIGDVAESGLDTLAASVRSARHIYPDFDICIACNNLSIAGQRLVQSLQATVYHQTGEELEIPPVGTAWKLYPPRLRPEAHEIVVDNDIIFLKRLEQVDQFLKSEKTLIAEDRYRLFGKFDASIRDDVSFNSGFYGMPPGFDFEKKINMMLRRMKELFIGFAWDAGTEFDEQGLVAKIIGVRDCIVVPLADMEICEPDVEKIFFAKHKALHFIGVNRDKTAAWDKFYSWFNRRMP